MGSHHTPVNQKTKSENVAKLKKKKKKLQGESFSDIIPSKRLRSKPTACHPKHKQQSSAPESQLWYNTEGELIYPNAFALGACSKTRYYGCITANNEQKSTQIIFKLKVTPQLNICKISSVNQLEESLTDTSNWKWYFNRKQATKQRTLLTNE